MPTVSGLFVLSARRVNRMLSETLKRALPEGYAEKGYSLDEPDTHFLVLYFKGEEIDRWNSHMATYAEIERACRSHAHLVGV